MARGPVRNLWQGVLPAVLLTAGFFLAPIAYTFALSFTAEGVEGPTLANYRAFLSEPRLTDALGRSLLLGAAVVAIGSLLAWPLAYFLAFAVAPRRRALLLLILIAPFWTSFTIRAFSWQLVLSDGGVIAWAVRRLTGAAWAPGFLYTFPASVFGLSLFSTMLTTLTLYSAMAGIDRRLIEANAVLGGTGWSGFARVIAPLAAPGWAIGAALSFIVAVGDYAVPTLLGGGFRPVLAQVMLSVLKGTYDLPMAATFAAVLVATVVVVATPLLLLTRGARSLG
jgi:spermidine/putrescine transport system permease protein